MRAFCPYFTHSSFQCLVRRHVAKGGFSPELYATNLSDLLKIKENLILVVYKGLSSWYKLIKSKRDKGAGNVCDWLECR